MRIRWWIGRTIFATLALLFVVQILVILNLSRIITEQHARIQKTAQGQVAETVSDSLMRLRREALSRAALYDDLIRHNMLVDKMVVNRGPNGEAE